MKKTILTASFVIAALTGGLVLQASQAFAGPREGGPRWERGERGERHLQRLVEKLELSAEQQEQIRAILDAHRAKTEPLRSAMKIERDKLRQAATAETFDEGAVREVARQKAAGKAEMMVERTRMFHQVHALLTPEQRDKAQELWREGGKQRGEGMKHRSQRAEGKRDR